MAMLCRVVPGLHVFRGVVHLLCPITVSSVHCGCLVAPFLHAVVYLSSCHGCFVARNVFTVGLTELRCLVARLLLCAASNWRFPELKRFFLPVLLVESVGGLFSVANSSGCGCCSFLLGLVVCSCCGHDRAGPALLSWVVFGCIAVFSHCCCRDSTFPIVVS